MHIDSVLYLARPCKTRRIAHSVLLCFHLTQNADAILVAISGIAACARLEGDRSPTSSNIKRWEQMARRQPVRGNHVTSYKQYTVRVLQPTEGTLAHASQRNLHKLLSKSRSLGASSDFSHLTAALHINARKASGSVVCGAAAVTAEGLIDDRDPVNATGVHCCCALLHTAPHSGPLLGASEDDLDWDDGQSYQEVHHVSSDAASDVVEVSVDPGMTQAMLCWYLLHCASTGRQTTRRPRRTFDKRQAQLLHRSHLLLLLGRALLFDRAADAPLVQVRLHVVIQHRLHALLTQAAMVSLLPDPPPPLRVGPGAITAKELHALVAWFCTTFKHKAAHLVRVVPLLQPAYAMSSQDAEFELAPPRGPQGFVDALLNAAASLEGTAEELCALMVALLRCHGHLARTVRCVRSTVRLSPYALTLSCAGCARHCR